MTVISMIGFSVLVLLVASSIFYLLWVTKRQRLEKQCYELNQTMQKHYHQLAQILGEIEPLMAHDKAFYEELQTYVKSHDLSLPVLGDIDGIEAKELYSFLLHIEHDAKNHLHVFSSPITQQLDQMRLSLMRARDSFSYADNEYKILASSFPLNVFNKAFNHDIFTKNAS